ncbi:MAG: radical SAM protein [Candidatus Thorarchaeota archaeon]
MRYECVKAKSLLSKREITADAWFHINRSLNAYRGCEHGCVYCDGMSERYYTDNFTTHIRIKENAPQVLRKELKKLGYTSQSELETETLWAFLDKDDAARLAMKTPRRIVIGVCGGVSDGFQPAEREHKVTRQILETLVDFRMPAFILTKSDLVLRDLDILKELNKVASVNVLFTITLHNDEERKIIEPKASSTPERYEALKQIRKAGIPGGVMSTPIIPFIGDNHENMTGLTKEAKRVGAQFIQFGGMTLKPGRQKEYFFNVIKKRYPDKVENIREVYANEDKYGAPIYRKLPTHVMLRGHEISKRIGISDRTLRLRLPYGHEANQRVLAEALDIKFYQNNLLGLPWSKNKPFHELAVKLERGAEDLVELRAEGRLATGLAIAGDMITFIEEILDTGSSSHFNKLLESIPVESEM